MTYAPLTVDNFTAALKQHYVSDKVQNMAERDNPLFALVKKNTNAGGELIKQPVRFRNGQGVAATAAKAHANATPGGYAAFHLTRKKNYKFAYLDDEILEATNGKENAFLDAKVEVDGAISGLGNWLAVTMYRGSLGVVSSDTTVGSTTLKLATPGDAFLFQGGQILKLSPNADGSSARTGSITVAAVNHDAGTITTSADIDAGISAAATGDYIFVDGTEGAVITGLDQWLPSVASTDTTWNNVDRTVDVARLQGHRISASGMSEEQALQEMASKILRFGGAPSHVFMNPERVKELTLGVGSKREYARVDVKGKASIGFQGFQVECGGKPITVLSDSNCPTDKAYMMQMDTWTLHSTGAVPRIYDRDGFMIRVIDDSSYQVRVAAFCELGCSAPGYNGVINFDL